MNKLCVFCGSSIGINDAYTEAARNLGVQLAKNKIELIYGGGSIGIMGIIADTVMENGGKVTGVIPKFLHDNEVGHDDISELIIVETMHERKMKMAELSEGFLALPGGIGTLEELFEIFTWHQLGIIKYPVGLLNTEGYFDQLLDFLKKVEKEGFMRGHTRESLLTFDEVNQVIPLMKNYTASKEGLDLSKT